MELITEKTYKEIANRLLKLITDRQVSYCNDRIEYDTDDFYSTLEFSAISYFFDDGTVEKIVPVWWNFTINIGGKDVIADFSWQELSNYI